MSEVVQNAETAPATAPSFGEAFRVWLKIGCLSFGGAAAQVAMMHRIIVDEKKWVEERRFLDAFNYCTLLPGPEAQQLATYLGYIFHGVRGGVAAGLLFVLPGALVMLGLCFVYALGRDLTLVEGLFFGIKAAVVAIVVEALLKISRRALKTPFLVTAAAVSFVAIAFLKIPFPIVILTAAIGGWALARSEPGWLGVRPGETARQGRPVDMREAFTSALAWGAIWWLPVALAAILLGPQHLLVDVGLFFSKLAVVTFGGAYAVLAYLADAAVNAKGWVTASEMIDGLGLAETTPGPTILVNQFAAFLAGWRDPAPLGPAAMATLTALMAVWVTFAPSFVWIFAGSPFMERARGEPRLAGALMVITAAVAGVIASLALTFALGVLFRRVGQATFGPFVLPAPDAASLSPWALALAALAGIMIFRLHRGVVETVMVLGGLGLALVVAARTFGFGL